VCDRPSAIDYLTCDILESVLDCFHVPSFGTLIPGARSGGNFARGAGFAVPLTGAGTKTTGIVRCDQPRALHLWARGGKKLESVPDIIMSEVLARILPIFE
jgi:mRNA-degrading endonuclease toxin of MazEF toxin-antitoxin module